MQTHILDVDTAAKEIYHTLFRRFPDKITPDDKHTLEVIEGLILKELKKSIEYNLNPVIRDMRVIDVRCYDECSFVLDIDQIDLELIVDSSISFLYLRSAIDKAMGVETFNLWNIAVVRGMTVLENLGDFRILQWEKEHLRNGKYVP